MKTKWSLGLAGVVVSGITVIAGIQGVHRAADSVPSAPKAAHATLSSRSLSYLGVYEPGVPDSVAPVVTFDNAAEVKVNIAAYYSAWNEPFQQSFAAALEQEGAVPLIQIEPYGARLTAVADGEDDGYLTSFASAVRRYGKSVVISFGHEMNGRWYPWGAGQTPAAVFVSAWRHIVDVFRSDGADNVTWLWAVNVIAGSGGSVQDPDAWWPGSSYVTWVGVDGYFYQQSETFDSLFNPTITQIRRVTHDPLFITETGIAHSSSQAAEISQLFAGARAAGVLGLLWFDDDKPSAHGPDHDWRIDNDPAALKAFHNAARTYLKET